MDPKQTRSFHQSPTNKPKNTITRTLATLRIPGISRQPQPTPETAGQPSAWEELRLPAKRVAIIGGSLLAIAFVGSGLWNLGKSAISSITSPSSSPSPAATTSTAPSAASKPQAKSPDQGCTDITARMNQAKVSSQQVDRVFYQQHPDRVNKTLTGSAADRDLRQEWCAIADKLIQQQKN